MWADHPKEACFDQPAALDLLGGFWLVARSHATATRVPPACVVPCVGAPDPRTAKVRGAPHPTLWSCCLRWLLCQPAPGRGVPRSNCPLFQEDGVSRGLVVSFLPLACEENFG